MPVSALAKQAVRSVTVRSTLTPDVTVDPFGDESAQRAGAEAGPAGLLLGILRPSVYVNTPAGVVPIEPYGKPDANYMPLVLGAAAAGFGALLYFAWKGLRKK